jgi:hypothetical protein
MPDPLTDLTRPTGVVSYGAAMAAGISPETWRWAAVNGDLQRIRRGVLADAQSLDERAILAAALACVPTAAISHGSATRVHPLTTLRPVPGPPTLSVDKRPRRTPWDEVGVRFLVSSLPPADITDVDGLRVTSIARTCIDVARITEFRDGLVVTDAALRTGLDPGELAETLLRMKGWPGTRTAARVLRHADARRESPLESLGAAVWVEQGLPRSVPQVWIYDEDGLVGRVDELWEDHHTVGEADGMIKYREPHIGVDTNPLVAEKQRQERLEAAGLAVVRYTWDDLWKRPRQTADRVRRTFDRGRFLTPRYVASPVQLGWTDSRRAWNARFPPQLDW